MINVNLLQLQQPQSWFQTFAVCWMAYCLLGNLPASELVVLYGEETARHVRRPLTTKTAPALLHLFVYQDPPLSHPLIGSSQLWAKHFPYLYPSTPILGITSTLHAYEDGTDSKFRNVGTTSSDAGRLPKRHNTANSIVIFSQFYYEKLVHCL